MAGARRRPIRVRAAADSSLSASVLPNERAAALASGAAGCLAKPSRPSELIEIVAGCWGRGLSR